MSLPKFDPSLWNLSLPVGLLLNSACGPKVPFEEDTDGQDSSTGWTETDTPPGTWSTSDVETSFSDTADTTTGVECTYDRDCPPDFYCSNGQCYYDYCADGCCEGGCYYNCYTHEDCGSGASCYYGNCYGAFYAGTCNLELAAIPLPDGASEGALSLAFVDADGNGEAELVQGRANGFEVDFGSGAPIVRNLTGVQPNAIAVADFTGDQIVDLVFADEVAGRLTLTRGLGNGSFQFVGNTPGSTANAAIGGDFTGDGLADVVTTDTDANGRIFVGDGAGGFSDNADVPFFGDSFAGTTIDANDAVFDIVYESGDIPLVLFGGQSLGGSQAGLSDTSSSFSRILAAADNGIVGSTQVAGIIPENRVVFPWSNSDFDVPNRGIPAVVPGLYDHIAIGDVDGDAISDIVVAGPDGVAVVLMFDGVAQCVASTTVPHSVVALAVGDIEGDGRAEIAVANESATTVLTLF